MEGLDIIQLKIILDGSKPSIWRRLLMDKSSTFEQLHYAIQVAFQWDNCHLHDFRIGNNLRIMEITEDDLGYDPGFGYMQVRQEADTLLETYLTQEKQRVRYEYDFGDSWHHVITVEKFLPREPNLQYPLCIKGKMNTPPEDIGGLWGFYDFIDIMADKKHPEHKELKSWYGGNYDPEHFDPKAVNDEMRILWREAFGK